MPCPHPRVQDHDRGEDSGEPAADQPCHGIGRVKLAGGPRASYQDEHGGPLQLVQKAVEAKRTEASDAKKERGRAHDQIWCVFDRDEHPNFAEAIAIAKGNGINLAISNPCGSAPSSNPSSGMWRLIDLICSA